MSQPELDPLPPDIREALRLERDHADLPVGDVRAMKERIRAAILVAAADLPGTDLDVAGPPDASAAASGAAASGAPSAVASGAAAAGTGVLGSKMAVALFVGGVALGAGAGIGGYRAFVEQRDDPAPVIVERPAAPAPAPAPPSMAPAPTPTPEAKADAPPPPAEVKMDAPAHRRPEPTATADGADVALRKEQALVEMARVALTRGNPLEALNAADRHAAQFPRGRLAEERESLAIQALVSLGEQDKARNRADAFRRNHPHSLLRPAIDALAPPAK